MRTSLTRSKSWSKPFDPAIELLPRGGVGFPVRARIGLTRYGSGTRSPRRTRRTRRIRKTRSTRRGEGAHRRARAVIPTEHAAVFLSSQPAKGCLQIGFSQPYWVDVLRFSLSSRWHGEICLVLHTKFRYHVALVEHHFAAYTYSIAAWYVMMLYSVLVQCQGPGIRLYACTLATHATALNSPGTYSRARLQVRGYV